MIIKKTSHNILLAISFFIIGIFIAPYIYSQSKSETGGEEIRFNSGKFTNPLLECEIGEDTIASRKLDFSPQMAGFIEKLKKEKNISEMSVYFRDLNNGPIVGVNQNTSFAPASLLKVPVLIAYLSWSEDVPSVLDEKILFEAPVDVGYVQQFSPTVPLQIGQTYSARELLEIMIKYSDNQALILLHKRLPKKYQNDLYTLLGVDPKLITDPTGTLTVRQYSIFFRVLFNASFLSRKNSEYALDLLSQSSFVDGLRSPIPAGLDVAHKFGERKIKGDTQQFHDCGIVYFPKHPYLLCVMTRGENTKNLIESIAETSKFVYNVIEKQYK